MADLNGDGGWVATGGSGGEGGYAVARHREDGLAKRQLGRAGVGPGKTTRLVEIHSPVDPFWPSAGPST